MHGPHPLLSIYHDYADEIFTSLVNQQVAKEMLANGPVAGWSREHAVRVRLSFKTL
jgi:hypothetical protein